MEQQVTKALADFSGAMLDDGIELRLEELRDGIARVRVHFDPKVCQECIVSAPTIEQILLPRLQKSAPGVQAVELVGAPVGHA